MEKTIIHRVADLAVAIISGNPPSPDEIIQLRATLVETQAKTADEITAIKNGITLCDLASGSQKEIKSEHKHLPLPPYRRQIKGKIPRGKSSGGYNPNSE